MLVVQLVYTIIHPLHRLILELMKKYDHLARSCLFWCRGYSFFWSRSWSLFWSRCWILLWCLLWSCRSRCCILFWSLCCCINTRCFYWSYRSFWSFSSICCCICSCFCFNFFSLNRCFIYNCFFLQFLVLQLLD